MVWWCQIPKVTGTSVLHMISKVGRVAQLVEQVNFNHWVTDFLKVSIDYVAGQVTKQASVYLNDGDFICGLAASLLFNL